MKKQYNVLVFPGGTEIGLEIQKSLSQCKNIQLYSIGLEVSNHAPFIFARHFVIPSIYDPLWVDSLNQIVTNYDINYIFPAYDDIIIALAQNTERIKAKIVSSPLNTCLITRSKTKTYHLLTGTVPVPRIYDNLDSIEQYPVFIKPDEGQGSQYARLVNSRIRLLELLEEGRNFLIMENLDGDEYTVDCFSDREAGLLFCGGRKRIRTKSGISMNSQHVHNAIFLEYANAISKKLKFHGAWFFQVKKDQHGTFKLLEIAPRIAGTMAVHRVQGINFAILSIYEQERIPVEILLNTVDVEIDRALINRYRHNVTYSVVYVDLDDTLILNGVVNVNLVRFLYQCINKGIRIVLLSKHTSDIDLTLRKYRLTGIFDEVIHLAQTDIKSDSICERDAILIDDSFSERKAVKERLGILTFDSSMLEMLLDERV